MRVRARARARVRIRFNFRTAFVASNKGGGVERRGEEIGEQGSRVLG